MTVQDLNGLSNERVRFSVSSDSVFPEPWHRRHAGRVPLAHRLLYVVGVGIYYQRRPFGECEDVPPPLKDMRYRQECYHSVVLADVHALVVCLQCRGELPRVEHHTL